MVKQAHSVETDAFVVVGVGVVRIDLDRDRVVFDCHFKHTKLIVGKSSVKEGFEMVRIYFESLRVQLDCRMVVALFASAIALGMELLRLLF